MRLLNFVIPNDQSLVKDNRILQGLLLHHQKMKLIQNITLQVVDFLKKRNQK